MKQAKQHLHPERKAGKLYFTSDQLVFFDEQLAVEHGKCLADGRITTKTREEVELETRKITNDRSEEDEIEQLLDELSSQ